MDERRFDRIRQVLRNAKFPFEVVGVAGFGSMARGEATLSSDIEKAMQGGSKVLSTATEFLDEWFST
ncbi:MAG: nucleotidyltransferase domain-containing protein [Candidatus Poribacteria bacterium]|nr:nucleotidyltransferase domain-containing protein [Candidatus Poribacteria bacterium]